MSDRDRKRYVQGTFERRALPAFEPRKTVVTHYLQIQTTEPAKKPENKVNDISTVSPSKFISQKSSQIKNKFFDIQPKQPKREFLVKSTQKPKSEMIAPEAPKSEENKYTTSFRQRLFDFVTRRQKLHQYLLPTMAVLLFVAGGFITVQTLITNKHAVAEVNKTNTDPNGDPTAENPNDEDAQKPSEVQPTDRQFRAYAPPDPMAPRYLRISKIGINARAYALGVDRKGNLRAPNNIYNVGWYSSSAKPGNPGAVLIDGHKSGVVGSAVFRNLHKLGPGDQIEIQRGDGQKFFYKVVSAESFPSGEIDMKKAVTSVEPGAKGLNIITCSGQLTRDQNSYTERLLVRAVQI